MTLRAEDRRAESECGAANVPVCRVNTTVRLMPEHAPSPEADGLAVSEVALTGESFPSPRSPNASIATPRSRIACRCSTVERWCLAAGGRALMAATGGSTEFGSTAYLVGSAQRERTPLEAGLDRTGRWLLFALVRRGCRSPGSQRRRSLHCGGARRRRYSRAAVLVVPEMLNEFRYRQRRHGGRGATS